MSILEPAKLGLSTTTDKLNRHGKPDLLINGGKPNRVGSRARKAGYSASLALKMKDQFIKHAYKRAKEYQEALDQLALGQKKCRKAGNGSKEYIYQTKPNVAALIEIHDRVWGRPQANLDLQSGGVPLILPSEIMEKNKIKADKKS